MQIHSIPRQNGSEIVSSIRAGHCILPKSLPCSAKMQARESARLLAAQVTGKGKIVAMPQNKQRRNADFLSEQRLPGFPGYRTRDGRSGLDPLDTNQESAHMEGTFYRNLFTLRARTHNISYLVLMFIFGPIPFVFCLFATVTLLIEALKIGDTSRLTVLILISIYMAISGAITINLALSLLEMAKIIPPLHGKPNKHLKERKNKLPKRRKDFQ
jgi:hypothetical protein